MFCVFFMCLWFYLYIKYIIHCSGRLKLNTNPKIQSNIREQLSIIDETKRSIEREKEASINEMNDYMNNYAHLTFDEYRRMKNGEPLDKKKR